MGAFSIAAFSSPHTCWRGWRLKGDKLKQNMAQCADHVLLAAADLWIRPLYQLRFLSPKTLRGETADTADRGSPSPVSTLCLVLALNANEGRDPWDLSTVFVWFFRSIVLFSAWLVINFNGNWNWKLHQLSSLMLQFKEENGGWGDIRKR